MEIIVRSNCEMLIVNYILVIDRGCPFSSFRLKLNLAIWLSNRWRELTLPA